MTRGKKIVVGCLVAVGVMIMAVVLAALLFVSWLKSPSPDLDGQRLVDADTLVYAELRLREEDQAVRQLLRTFITARNQAGLDELKSMDLDGVPPFVRNFLPMLQEVGAGEVKDKELDKVLPAAAFLTASGTQGPAATPLLAINFPASGHVLALLDWFMIRAARNDSDLQVVDHGDETLFNIRQESWGWFSIVGTDVLYSPEQPAVITGIQNLARTQAPPSPPALVGLLSTAPEDAAFQVAAVGEGATALPALLSPWVPGLADLLSQNLAGARSVSGWARLESVDRLAGVLFVDAPPSTEQGASGGSRYTLEFEDGALRFTLTDAGMEGGKHRWEFALEGVEEMVRLAARRLGGGNGITIGP